MDKTDKSQRMGILGNNLRALLCERGMTQKELARAAGVTEACVSAAVNGTRELRGSTLRRMRNALGCTYSEILKGV